MPTPSISTSLTRVFLSVIAVSSLFSGSQAFGQVNGVGISDPSLFDNVFNIPTDPDSGFQQSFGGVAGETTQINLSDGGTIGSQVDFLAGVELNIDGGNLRRDPEAFEGSEVNISGGTIGSFFGIRGAETNISGGFFEGSLIVGGGEVSPSSTTISGGVFNGFTYISSIFESPINASISGGNFRGNFTVIRFGDEDAPTGNIELIGGDFQINGTPISGSTLSLAEDDVFTGTLQDGSGFLFSPLTGDDIEQLTLTRVAMSKAEALAIHLISTPEALSTSMTEPLATTLQPMPVAKSTFWEVALGEALKLGRGAWSESTAVPSEEALMFRVAMLSCLAESFS